MNDGREAAGLTRRDFCTYLDRRYLSRGLALAESLRRHCATMRLWVLCLDDEAHAALTAAALPGIVPIALADFEAGDSELLAAKANRSLVEYYFTCTPSLPLFVFRTHPEVGRLTYIDADLFFFGDPEPLFEEIGDSSIAIIPHRFPEAMRVWEKCGIYNVGWLTFRRDVNALACLRWWRERCLEWCYDIVEPTRFADQKYLDDWPSRFAGVHVVTHKGANVASWNVLGHHLATSGDRVLVDGQALIFFHFHHLKQRASWLFETDFHVHAAKPSRIVKRHIFSPYLKVLHEHARVAARRLNGVTDEPDPIRESLQGTGPIRFREVLRDVRAGKSLVYLNGRVC
jgi:hypothetical protein